MKAAVYDIVELIEDVQSDFSEYVIPRGTRGTVVECYSDPEGYAVDVAIPEARLVGGYRYENVVLRPEQFTVIERYEE
jgi:hypothetical protein